VLGSRELAFSVSLGALGNVLAIVTIAPTLVRQIALDFSAIPVLIAGVFGGPALGILTGILAGILPSMFFGYIGGQLGPLGFSACVGKALHGYFVAILAQRIPSLERRTLLLVPIVLLAFIPESIWLYVVFSILVPLILPNELFLSALVIPILAKAWFEVTVMAFFMSALVGHSGFKRFLETHALGQPGESRRL